MATDTKAPDALLLLTASCPFCPAVLAALGELVKVGRIGRLEIVNIEARPEVARHFEVRSVPWVRLGSFELDGLRSKAELEQWAQRAGTREGVALYLSELLAVGGLNKVIAHLTREPHDLDALLVLLANPDTDLHVQLGIAAVMEELRGTPALQAIVDQLGALLASPEPRLRGDACHYLALSENPRAIPHVRRLLTDPDPHVREVAQESLAALEQLAAD
jgi:thioredoxin-like negative regulator of GroEL